MKQRITKKRAERDTQVLRDLNPEALEHLDDAALRRVDFDIHVAFNVHFAGSSRTDVDGLTREDVLNAHLFVLEEAIERGLEHPSRDRLDKETARLNPDLAHKIYGEEFVVEAESDEGRFGQGTSPLPQAEDGGIGSPPPKKGGG